MSTEPFIYSYDSEIRKYLDDVHEACHKLLKRGLLMLKDLPQSPSINSDTSAIILLYRNAMALIDALSELLGLPSVEAIKIIARSFFELKCSLEFILESNTIDRAIAYQTQHIISQISQYEKYNISTSAGKEFAYKWKTDKLFGNINTIGADTSQAIANLNKQLAREPYKTTYAKLKAIKRMHWYSIDNGPSDFCQLCNRLGYPIAYDFFYRQWSKSVHSTAAYVDSFFADQGQGKMQALRAFSGYQFLSSVTLSLIVDFFLKTTERLVPKHHRRFVLFYKNIYLPFRKKNIDVIKINEST
jgi:hypothetical protein